MRHYVPVQDAKGEWVVAFMNHRGQFVAVLECPDLVTAYSEAAAMTRRAYMEQVSPPAIPRGGNRYLRGL